MKVLLIGGGGREHALGWKLVRSPRVDELISLPGNPGLAELGPTIEGISPTEVGAISAMARVQGVDLVVIGPEAPLAAGLADALERLRIPVFGPTKNAARLESSKAFAKEVMISAGVATGASEVFDDPADARAHIDSVDGPYVVKADGLAGGKGVLVSDSRADAIAWAERWADTGRIVVEEYLDGPEISVFAVCTPNGVVPLEPARDYKRLEDGDRGPNTGGMGSYSPVSDLPDDLVERTITEVIEPTLSEMESRGTPFTGFLYAGLVLTGQGPKVLEFNVRLGDPETQAVIPRLESDLVDLLEGAEPTWSDLATVNVVLAAGGYPASPVAGASIRGLPAQDENVLVFQAGTKRDGKRLLVDGGRVLNVVGTGESVVEARDRAYDAVARISWPGMTYRSDIGDGLSV